MSQAPIDVYSWPTPNGHKVHIMLEECGLPYVAHPVNIGKGDQFAADFLAISPNNKIPAIVDPQGLDGQPMSLFESGAILVYLASKTGQLLPQSDRARFEVLQWLMFQMGGVGPMLGQAHHFRLYAPEKLPYAIERYTNEARRLYGVIDRRLSQSAFVGGPEYSIADIAIFPWLRNWENQGIVLSDFPHLKTWFEAMAARPAVQRGVKVLADLRKPLTGDKERDILFGKSQYAKR
ncbi:glutathione binding-like protein [Variovorax guangxiensis]|uniref:Glutathione S-transferase family protein n=1 Tax=Variovorax guangxiensis TaxID=1775474 RepID=A0A502E0Q9_9BURK|nr:glutathione binding-like protein [Variovorax guangxiensis]RZI65518.1 MAG: glutathione S-transferase family protein [Variovorax sp.]TPG26386.1 glutathione S-transferase family protein [Variovorax ginsengisoli]TPG30111.1 glutathione S-transferase family protein [Variovorax guangxiensis]